MNLEDDFVTEEIIDLNVRGKIFKYKPTTAGEEIDWLNEYMITDSKGQTKRDFAKLNKLKLKNIVGAPYTKEIITKITGIDKEFSDMTPDQRWILISKLKGTLLNGLIDAMTKYDAGDSEVKKN